MEILAGASKSNLDFHLHTYGYQTGALFLNHIAKYLGSLMNSNKTYQDEKQEVLIYM